MKVDTKATYYDEILFDHLSNEIKDFAIFMVDDEGTIVTWNPGVKRLLGYDEKDFVGREFAAIFMPDEQARGIPKAGMERARRNGRADDDRWHRRADATTFWASGLLTRVTDDNGEIRGYVKIMRDLTEKRKLETTLAEHAQRLARANSDLKNFAGVVSHDLQAPIQTMIGFASLATQQVEKGDQAIQESLQRIIDGAQQMRSLVEGITEISFGLEDALVSETVDCNLAVAIAISNLDGKIRDLGASVAFQGLPVVKADLLHLSRVFQNLIENALKYRSNDAVPKIEITGSVDSEIAEIRISDNGIGIARENQGKIFELFTQVDNYSSKRAGRGIGLAVCKRIIEHFGGDLTVESELGKGATFVVRLSMGEIVGQRVETGMETGESYVQ